MKSQSKRKVLPNEISLTLIMVVTIWLVILAASAISTVTCQEGKDSWSKNGEDWRFLDGFLDWAKEEGYKDNTAGARSARAKGTFWNNKKATRHPDIFVEPGSCGISVYYPTMTARHADKDKGLDPNTTWGAPFGIAPWCREVDPMPGPDDYPGYDTSQEGDHSVVFHQLYNGGGWKDDCCVPLT